MSNQAWWLTALGFTALFAFAVRLDRMEENIQTRLTEATPWINTWEESEYQKSLRLLKELGYDQKCKSTMRITEFVVCVLEQAQEDQK